MTEQFYTYLNDVYKAEYENNKYFNSVGIRKHFEDYQLKKAALDNLNDIFLKVGQQKFLDLSFSALSLENFEKINIQNLNSDIQKKYEEELMKFNKKFIVKNWYNFPLLEIMNFLCTQLALGEISKEFIDAMKLNPDAPEEYRNSLIKYDWNKEQQNKEQNKEQQNKEDNKWYENIAKMNDDDLIMEADNLALNNDYEKAIKIYKTISKDEKHDKIILCYLAAEDVIAAKMHLERANFEEEKRIFYDDLILHVTNYDFDNFMKLLRKYSHMININIWSTTMLLRIKQSISQ